MAKISLRAYNREIEALIEHGQSEEAIAHCKFILKTYPKHLDTYRLLGKAFLETQRYSEGADILQRILSVQPDDFVSQIGMSIIREDEGNLDAALFHMERAFEIQPSNAAIQDELRRLYGRRDGVEPPKLRLTRGALVRMYARGDLYRQAIAEARAALAEDNQRLDIQIILARMYFQIGQKAESAEICSKLVAKLPYCVEANRILAEVLPETSRAEDAKVYQQHLLALDPYLGYLSETTPLITQVPDQVVTMDRLEWTPSLETSQQPAWANTLGISIDTHEEKKAEDWLSPSTSSAETYPSGASDAKLASPGENAPELAGRSHQAAQTPDLGGETDEIPGWMRSAGWGVNESGASEEPVQDLAEPVSDMDAEPAPADMPDWLKNLAPAENTLPAADEEQDKLDWLSSILPEEPVATVESNPAEVPQPTSSILPPAPAEEMVLPVNDELPDWLRTGTASAEEPTGQSQLSEEPLPDWLTESSEMPSVSETNLPVEEEIKPEMDLIQDNPPVQIPTTKSLDESATEPPLAMENQAAQAPDLSNMDDAMAWLEGLAVKQGADEEALITKPEDRQDQPPEWVVDASQGMEEPVAAVTTYENQPPEAAGSDLLQPEGSLTAEPETVSTSEVPHEMPAAEPGNPPMQTGETAQAVAQEPAMAAVDSTEASAILEPESGPEKTNPIVPETANENPAAPAAAGEDMDAAFAWLESLAAKQGVENESLLVSPEERLETPPDWIKEQTNESEGNQPVQAESVGQTPAGLETAPVSETEIAAQNEIQPSTDLPDWLKAGEPSGEPAPEPLLPVEEQSLQPEEEEKVEPVREPESAGWIKETGVSMEPEAPPQGAVEPAASAPAEPGFDMPEWPAEPSHEEITQPVKPHREEAAEPALPDWLQDQPAAGSAEKGIEQPIDVETPPLPDWLQNMEPEKIDVPLPAAPVVPAEAALVPLDLSSAPAELLSQAEGALAAGQIESALTAYNTLVQKGEHIEDTIHDLKDALYRYPVESSIWQTLGDALIRANQVQDALDAYTKAEELLK